MRLHSVIIVSIICWVNFAAGYQKFCRCSCNEKSLIETVEKCGQCTKDFCIGLDQALCESSDEMAANDILISCFEIESFKEYFIIYSFVLLVIGFIIWGTIREYRT